MSDLATSCEYHTPEATCLSVADNPKAQANRHLRCLNDEKQACCYVCDSRCECTISCRFLGSTENQHKVEEAQESKPETPVSEPKTAQTEQTRTIPAVFCTSCNVEMTAKQGKLRIAKNDPPQPKQFGEYTPQTEDVLPVLIYLCPLCSRIEFRAAK